MSQAERMNSASNAWEADPWDASDEIADAQLAGFHERAAKPIDWTSIRKNDDSIFGIASAELSGADVEYYATHDGEEMLLMQLAWHGFPDPPEWRLVTRPSDRADLWVSWGHFEDLPEKWKILSDGS